ncbi:MAG: hypothetical protein KY469_10575 [Actinobacteria bacterium]|nr:hypothetical protein [Actinomycetota bacterium]
MTRDELVARFTDACRSAAEFAAGYGNDRASYRDHMHGGMRYLLAEAVGLDPGDTKGLCDELKAIEDCHRPWKVAS